MKRLVVVQPTHIFGGELPSGAEITIVSEFGKANDETLFVTREEAPALITLLHETFHLTDEEVDAA